MKRFDPLIHFRIITYTTNSRIIFCARIKTAIYNRNIYRTIANRVSKKYTKHTKNEDRKIR